MQEVTKTISKELRLHTDQETHDKLAELATLRCTSKSKIANRILDIVVRDRALIKQLLQLEITAPKEEKVEPEKPKKQSSDVPTGPTCYGVLLPPHWDVDKMPNDWEGNPVEGMCLIDPSGDGAHVMNAKNVKARIIAWENGLQGY